MKIFATIIGIIVFTYLGYAIGLAAYCSQVPSLQRIKKYAIIIPAYILLFPILLLSVKNKIDFIPALKSYLTTPEKGIVFAVIFEELLSKAQGKAYNYQKKQNIEWQTILKQKIFQSAIAINYKW